VVVIEDAEEGGAPAEGDAEGAGEARARDEDGRTTGGRAEGRRDARDNRDTEAEAAVRERVGDGEDARARAAGRVDLDENRAREVRRRRDRELTIAVEGHEWRREAAEGDGRDTGESRAKDRH